MEKYLNPRKRRRDDLSSDLATLTKRFKDLNLNPDEDGSNSIDGFHNSPTNWFAGCPATAYNAYNPELGIDNNPIYYEKNKILYDLHAERVKRHCHCAVHTGWGQTLTDDMKAAVENQTNRYKARKLC